jgi:dihydroorotase
MIAREFIETPGFIDAHVHYREPGLNNAETIATGTRAALLGGFVLTADMPNNPGRPTWTIAEMEEKHRIGQETAYAPIAFNTGSQPESDNIGHLAKMAEMSLLYKIYGAITTGSHRDYEASDFRENIAEWHRVAPDKIIGLHAGRENLEDFIGLIANDFDHPLLVHHINSSREVEIIQRAKNKGLNIFSAVTPHHMLKTSHDTRTEGWFARMMPELAHQDEAEKLIRHLADGDIDIVETDHAPHTEKSKWNAEHANPEGDKHHESTCFGVPGIEFAAPLMFYQARRGFISMERLIDAMSTRPAAILGVKLDQRTKVTWEMVDYRIEDESYSTVYSDARWTPYLGMLAVGVPNTIHISDVKVMETEDILTMAPRVITDRGSVI